MTAHPSQWHRALPSQSEASVHPAVCSRWTARERKRKRIGPACSDGFLRFLFYPPPHPFPFCMPSRPQTFSEQSQQAVNTDQHRSPPAPGYPATKVFSRMFWGGDGPQATLPSSGQLYVQPRHIPSSYRPPRASVCLQGPPPAQEKLLSESALATRPHPAGTSSLPAPV